MLRARTSTNLSRTGARTLQTFSHPCQRQHTSTVSCLQHASWFSRYFV